MNRWRLVNRTEDACSVFQCLNCKKKKSNEKNPVINAELSLLKQLTDRLLGAVGVCLLRHGHLSESCDVAEMNDLSRLIVAAMKSERGSAWLGKINFYPEDRENPVMWEWTEGEIVRRFSANFVLPSHDAAIEKMILDRLTGPYAAPGPDARRVSAILKRVTARGGVQLHWV